MFMYCKYKMIFNWMVTEKKFLLKSTSLSFKYLLPEGQVEQFGDTTFSLFQLNLHKSTAFSIFC